jgi:sialate O-acetylesterase
MQIRNFKEPNAMASRPKEDIKSQWQECNPSNAGRVSAVAYFFARELYNKTKIPVGIIESYWGGTAIETWLSPEALANDPEFGTQAANMKFLDMDSVIKKNSDDFYAWLNDIIKKDPGYDNGAYGWAKQHHPEWEQLTVPGRFTASIKNKKMKDGIVWLSTTVDLTDEDIKDTCYLGLGKIVDDNLTFVNAVKVGFINDGKYIASKYAVAPNLLHTGTNNITVRVMNYGNTSYSIGLTGTEDLFYFKIKSNSYPLAKSWNYKVSMDTVFPVSHHKNINPEHIPTLLYNGMIAPLTNFTVAGILWYQGESNENKGYQYRTLMKSLITDWRTKFNDRSLPFLYVQLPKFRYETKTPEESKWAEIREAQQMALTLPNTAMAMTIDLGEAANIHPTNKQEVGKRLALLYRKHFNGEKELKIDGPVFEKIEFKNSICRLYFKNTEQGLTVLNNDLPIKGFQVETSGDGKFIFVSSVAIKGKNLIEITSPDGKPITAVRYAWADNPGILNLTNSEGLLVHPFRTDHYKGLSYDSKYDLNKSN